MLLIINGSEEEDMMENDIYGQYLGEIRNLEKELRKLKRVGPDKFYSLPDQEGWHLMSRIATAADDLFSVCDDYFSKVPRSR